MPDALSFLRPLRYDGVSRLVVVQTGAAHRISGVVREMRRLFPAAKIDVLLRESPGDLAPRIEADSIRVVTFEERSSVVRELRSTRFDVIVMQLSRHGAQGLRSLPFLLRGKRIVAINDSLDHFPINLFRLRDLAHHFGLASQGIGVLLAPVAFLYLLGSVGFIRVRGTFRKMRRGPDRGGRMGRGGPRDHGESTKARAATSEGS